MKPLPNTVEDLIAELSATYKPRCIGAMERPADAHRWAGQVELVEALRARLDRQNEKGDPRDAITTTNIGRRT